MTHSELVSSLAAHLWQPSRLIWEGVAIGSRWLQGGCPIPDVLTAQKSYTNPKLTAYECKASRADFQSDMRSGKWLKYREVTNRVLFAVPKGLLKREEVPTEAGLIVYNPEKKSWTVHRAGRPAQIDLAAFEWQSLLFARCWEGEGTRDLRYQRLGLGRHELEDAARRQGKALAGVKARLTDERVEHELLGVLREHFDGSLPDSWRLQKALEADGDPALLRDARRASRILVNVLEGK